MPFEIRIANDFQGTGPDRRNGIAASLAAVWPGRVQAELPFWIFAFDFAGTNELAIVPSERRLIASLAASPEPD